MTNRQNRPRPSTVRARAVRREVLERPARIALIALMLGTLALLWALAAPRASEPETTPSAATTAKAIFAGGCFWCTEADFEKVPGVVEAVSGYIGGDQVNPTYKEVSAGRTGHTEAVEVEFDPAQVSYEELVEHFWRTIDPTVADRQFCDVGSQYRSGIFYLDEAQREIAERSRTALEETKPFTAAIVTEITAAERFYQAEEYHQDYAKKNPIRYNYYRRGCGRDRRLTELWGGEK